MQKIYEKSFGMRQPYQIIVDAEFCKELLKCKIVAKEVLPTVLGGAVKVMASNCVLEELRKLDARATDESMTGSIFIAKRFEQRTCRHSPCMASTECVKDLIGTDNQHHYLVAVQNFEARKELRKVLGVPLLFIHHGLVLMEDPTKETMEYSQKKELSKLKAQEFELKAISKLVGAEQPAKPKNEEEKKKKKRKGPKQPNPLSVKRTKKLSSALPPEPPKPKRKRRPKKKRDE